MTVSTQVSRNEYTGNGATTQYDFTFRIMDKSDLLVQTLDASETITTLTLDADYSVTGVNRYPGGKVVLNTPLPDGYKISIERSIPVTQETSIRNQGGFFPEIHEDAFDKLTMIIQRMYGWWSGLALKKPSWLANYYDAVNNRIRNLSDPSQDQDAATKIYVDNGIDGSISHSEDLFKRSLRVPEGEVGILPPVAARKNHLAAFNSEGQPITVLPESGSAADVLIDLASTEEGLGGSLIGLVQKGTVQGALTNVFVVSDADNTGASDVTAKIQSWIDKAAAIGGGTVKLPEGTFLCNSYTNQVILPGDDGTAAPAWVAAGTDANIAPEATHTMYAALNIPHNVTLQGSGRGLTIVRGNWDPNTTAMTLGSGIGIYVSRDSVGNSGTVNYGLKDITLSNFFIGRLVEGISFASNESNLKVTSCTFSGIFQGMDQHTWSGQVETTGCVAGDVIGGWWLQRNNTQNTAYIPPYPATDVYLLGWADSCPSETLTAGQINGTWGALQNNADTFFDTYFFKSANSATTASGGRLTNNSNNTGTIPQWKGVAGRARTVLSRYGRPINRMDIDNLKLIRQHRTPIYLSNGLGESVISHAYFEGIGLVDNTGSAVSGNLFGIDVVDPLNTSESGVGYMVTQGGIGLKNFTASSKNQHAPLSDNADRKNAFYRGTLYVPSGTVSTTQAEIDRVSVWDGTTTDIRYLRYADKAFTQPLQFTLGGPTFRYAEGNFTPTLTVNGSLITGLAVSRGHYKRNGNTIMGGVQFSSSAAMALSAGQVVIGGLPFTIPSGAIAYHHGQVDVYSHAAAGVNVRPFFNDGTTTDLPPGLDTTVS
ncbi:hypothetical protein [Raoultella planticola]|uniref:hypothetical protein n=1 Tax=Raoultella planticola TaxID=575 RepID=UPI003526AFAA